MDRVVRAPAGAALADRDPVFGAWNGPSTSPRAGDRAALALADQQLARYGLALQLDTCAVHEFWVGQARFPYQWCRVGRR